MDNSNIEELDLKELSKFSKVKRIGKKCVLGVIAVGLALSLAPNIEYYATALTSNPQISEQLSAKDKKQFIKDLYSRGINENPHLTDEQKSLLIDSFCTYVIEPYGDIFTEKVIQKMYISAKTESVAEVSEFVQEHGWWGGDYIPLFNNMSFANLVIDGEVSEESKKIIAHEQVHALLKNGFINSGFTDLTFAYGLNEGCTTIMVSDFWSSYSDLAEACNLLGLIIGHDKLMHCFFNSDTDMLIKIMEEYIPKEEAIKFITLLDEDVFSGYYQTVLQKNDLDFKTKEQFEEEKNARIKQLSKILKDMCESKTGLPMNESKIGRLLSMSYFFRDSVPLLEISYKKSDTVTITINHGTAIQDGENIFSVVNLEKTMDLSIEDLENGNFDLEEFLTPEPSNNYENNSKML